MEQLEFLHNKNDHMTEQLDEMMTIVTTIRGMFAKWSRNEYTHGVGNEAEVMRAQGRMKENDVGEAEQQAEARMMTPQQQIIEKDILNIVNNKRGNTTGAWKTGISRTQVGQLTQWMKDRIMTAVDKKYALQDDRVFAVANYAPDKREKDAQNKLYDALTDGYHGRRIESEGHEGYRFRMEQHNCHGW
eukprot:12414379-Heterocapsa_arctica.AAC.1